MREVFGIVDVPLANYERRSWFHTCQVFSYGAYNSAQGMNRPWHDIMYEAKYTMVGSSLLINLSCQASGSEPNDNSFQELIE